MEDEIRWFSNDHVPESEAGRYFRHFWRSGSSRLRKAEGGRNAAKKRKEWECRDLIFNRGHFKSYLGMCHLKNSAPLHNIIRGVGHGLSCGPFRMSNCWLRKSRKNDVLKTWNDKAAMVFKEMDVHECYDSESSRQNIFSQENGKFQNPKRFCQCIDTNIGKNHFRKHQSVRVRNRVVLNVLREDHPWFRGFFSACHLAAIFNKRSELCKEKKTDSGKATWSKLFFKILFLHFRLFQSRVFHGWV